MLQVIDHLITGSKVKNYIQPVAYGFLEELCQQVNTIIITFEKFSFSNFVLNVFQQVDIGTFNGIVWPALKKELSLSWENQTFDTLNLLLVVHNKFPQVVDKLFWKEVFGASSISEPECFSELTTLILVRDYFFYFYDFSRKLIMKFFRPIRRPVIIRYLQG